MNTWKRLALAGLLCAVSGSTALAHGGFTLGIGIGLPIYPRPCYYGGPYYYPYPYPYPYYQPVVVPAAPVVVQPAPVVVQPAAAPAPAVAAPVANVAGPVPNVAPPPVSVAAPAAPTTMTATYGNGELKNVADVNALLQMLNDPDEKTRSDAVIQLGRLKADRAVDPVCATLASDKSPLVRESAAKALGLIGAPRALTALIHAAQADPDNNVRHSAHFAVEIIKLNSGMN
jgi:hypothetical protein